MKTTLLLSLGLSAMPLFAAEPQNLVVNGDFQTGNGKHFYATPPWYNLGAGFNQGVNARTEINAELPGAFAGTINDRYDMANNKFGPTAHCQKTDHTIQAGDAFSLAYDWRPADEHWQRRRDTVRFVLFATQDDKLGSAVVWSQTLDSDFFLGSLTEMKLVAQQTEVVPAAAVGKKLMITFHGMDLEDGVSGKTHFARVDNIFVTAVPKPRKP